MRLHQRTELIRIEIGEISIDDQHVIVLWRLLIEGSKESMCGAQLFGLHGDTYVGVCELPGDRLGIMTQDHDEIIGTCVANTANHPIEHRDTQDLVKEFGQTRLHAGPSSCGQDDGRKFLVHRDSYRVRPRNCAKPSEVPPTGSNLWFRWARAAATGENAASGYPARTRTSNDWTKTSCVANYTTG